MLFLPRLEAWALNVKPAGQEDEDSESSQGQQSPQFPASSAKKRSSPAGFYAPAASPFKWAAPESTYTISSADQPEFQSLNWSALSTKTHVSLSKLDRSEARLSGGSI